MFEHPVAVTKTRTIMNKEKVNDNPSSSHRVRLFRNRLISQVSRHL